MSNPRTALRLAIILEWLLIAGGVFFAFAGQPELPEELRAYVEAQDNAPSTTFDAVLLIVGAASLLVSFVSSVGLWFFRRWARLPYVVTTIFFPLSTLFDAPSVRHPFEAGIEEFSLLLPGFIIALIYYAPIEQFQRGEVA